MESRPALQVLYVAVGERVQTPARWELADVYGKTAVIVLDNHFCYEAHEISQKCVEVRASRNNVKVRRKRRKGLNRIDKDRET